MGTTIVICILIGCCFGICIGIELERQRVRYKVRPPHIFHGGCLGCTAQEKHGISYCKGCQYHKANWSLPDLSEK